jgi:hypothetical protein
MRTALLASWIFVIAAQTPPADHAPAQPPKRPAPVIVTAPAMPVTLSGEGPARARSNPSPPSSAPAASAPKVHQADARVDALLPHIRDAAQLFASSAQQYMCRETLRQRVIHAGAMRRAKHSEGFVAGSALRYDTRQIESWFAFTTIGKSPAIHEVRQVLAVDKDTVLKEEQGRTLLRDALLARDDQAKSTLPGKFADEALKGVATDLGQLILLFEGNGLKNFQFDFEREETIRGVRTMVMRYAQVGGKEAVRINENGKELKETLRGFLWASEPDGVPLRITLITTRKSPKQEVRDESEVDYATIGGGALLPAAVIHRRYEDDVLAAEDDFRYTNWQSLK